MAVWRHVKAERGHVTNPRQYADLRKQLCPKFHIEYVPKEDIAQHTPFLDRKWENTKAVPGSHQVHCVRADGSDFVKVSDTTNSTECRSAEDARFASLTFRYLQIQTRMKMAKTQTPMKMAKTQTQMKMSKARPLNAIDVDVGQWAVIVYDGEQYPGEVTAISDVEEVEVSMLYKSGSCWKWPQPKEMIYCHKKDIVRLISPPIAAGHRGQFIFSDL